MYVSIYVLYIIVLYTKKKDRYVYVYYKQIIFIVCTFFTCTIQTQKCNIIISILIPNINNIKL